MTGWREVGGSVICHLNLNGPVFICFYLFRKTDKKQANKQNDKRRSAPPLYPVATGLHVNED